MPTNRQEQDFAEVMRDSVDEVKMSSLSLENAISWIQDHLDPDDVFSEKSLIAWAETNGYVKED